MNNKWPKAFTFIFIGIFLIAGLLYLTLFFTVVEPKKAELDQVEKEIAMYENAVNRISDQEHSENNDEEQTKLLTQIPDTKETDSVLASLNKLASRNSVTINYVESIEPSESSTTQLNQASYLVEVGADNLRNVNVFIAGMLDGERFATVDTIEISQNEADVFARINFTTYYTNN
ncbi:type 4a pilus biogenesis protein PilO [Ornithinibacillus californiensis]|uniref:type 4a pilus biogenesis protein PilO n=1 Tax=Ornithinibacillus californiensis TaxID=161536 RepID=UPI00064DE14F|nr:type 4a pilus biogenesis protein PilO [Ornithinibacillus californiensis]